MLVIEQLLRLTFILPRDVRLCSTVSSSSSLNRCNSSPRDCGGSVTAGGSGGDWPLAGWFNSSEGSLSSESTTRLLRDGAPILTILGRSLSAASGERAGGVDRGEVCRVLNTLEGEDVGGASVRDDVPTTLREAMGGLCVAVASDWNPSGGVEDGSSVNDDRLVVGWSWRLEEVGTGDEEGFSSLRILAKTTCTSSVVSGGPSSASRAAND